MPPKRRAPNAFILYRSERLPVYALKCSRQGIAMSSAALSADIARMWNQESDDVQSEYRVKSRMQQQQLDELGHDIADSTITTTTTGALVPLGTLTGAGTQLMYRASGSPELPKKAGGTVWTPGPQTPRTSIHGIRYVLSQQPRDLYCDQPGGTIQARLSLDRDHAYTHAQTPACHQPYPAHAQHFPLSPELPFAQPQQQPSPRTAHVKGANQSSWTSPQLVNHSNVVNFYPDQSDRNSRVSNAGRHRPRFMPYDISHHHQHRASYQQQHLHASTTRCPNMSDKAFPTTAHTASVNNPIRSASLPHLLYRQEERKGGLSIYDLVEATDVDNHVLTIDQAELGQALRVAQNEVARLENLIEKSMA
ncbi:hypothetical protein HDU81_000269 [Chytriomyces hyalinus]|nr:hypothetical protein HDU81_000269 [Chytriomyces hyalinus]